MNHPQPGDEQAEVIRPELGDQQVNVGTEASGFTANAPTSVPAFEIPDVALDAIGLPADVMAQQVPTLAEAVAPVDAGLATVLYDPQKESTEAAPLADPQEVTRSAEQAAQAQPGAADTWVVQMQMRIDRLADDVRALNDRLDRFVNHTKV